MWSRHNASTPRADVHKEVRTEAHLVGARSRLRHLPLRLIIEQQCQWGRWPEASLEQIKSLGPLLVKRGHWVLSRFRLRLNGISFHG